MMRFFSGVICRLLMSYRIFNARNVLFVKLEYSRWV
jgi:hypothetical protein